MMIITICSEKHKPSFNRLIIIKYKYLYLKFIFWMFIIYIQNIFGDKIIINYFNYLLNKYQRDRNSHFGML